MKKLYALYRELILPAGLLAALVIGAGMFALPYAFMKAGFVTGLIYLSLFAGVCALIHVLYARIIKETPEKHRFVGYARIYLGEKGSLISIITTLCGTFLSLTAYLVLSRSFIYLVWEPQVANAMFLLFWITGTVAIVAGIKRLASLEFLVVGAMLFIMAAIFGFGVSTTYFETVKVPLFDPLYFFVPYGVVLFSLNGRAAVSSIKEYFEENKISEKRFYTALSLGTIIPAIFYFLFVLGVVGLSTAGVTDDAISGLTSLPQGVLMAIGLLGIFSLWTSYVLLGLEAKEILRYDFKLSETIDAVATTCIPLALYLAGFKSFMTLISVSGGIFLAVESILVVLIWKKIKKDAHWWYNGLIGVFVLGGLYEILMWGCEYLPLNGWCGIE